MNERRLTDEEQKFAISAGHAEELLRTAYLCPDGRGFFKKHKTGTDGYILFHDKEDDDRCGCCGNTLPSDITKKTCCGVGDPGVPGVNHALSCEHHRVLDLSPPTHSNEAGEALCVGLIVPIELVKKGCPNCHSEGVNYCPTCNICVPCGFKNDGHGSHGGNCCPEGGLS